MTKAEFEQLPFGTVVFDYSDEELGEIIPAEFGSVKSKIQWDNGLVTVVISDGDVSSVRVSRTRSPRT